MVSEQEDLNNPLQDIPHPTACNWFYSHFLEAAQLDVSVLPPSQHASLKTAQTTGGK